MGTKEFAKLCDKLAGKYGERFRPNALLKEMAARGETFYGRFQKPAEKQKAA
jgi:3-hydroxyacyl-CoA dehydrogenase/enoyl-CoA hydratase/3-hydroxybutyryl-CoA epimerase